MHNVFAKLKRSRHSTHRSSRRLYRQRQRAAVKRALTGAALYLGRSFPVPATLRDAADCCGSNPKYIEAAATLLKSEDANLIQRVLAGHISLMDAAASIQKRAQLIAAYRECESNGDDLVALAKAVGPASIWDNVIAPVI